MYTNSGADKGEAVTDQGEADQAVTDQGDADQGGPGLIGYYDLPY